MIPGAAQLIALTIAYESASQGEHGMMACASAIWNRSPNKSPLELGMICIERKQFSCWNDKFPSMTDINYWHTSGEPNLMAYRRCLEIAISMVNGTFKPTLQATHYHRFDIQPAWSNSLIRICRIGDHVFYTNNG